MAELIEREVEAYQKMDPDPFDERPPSKVRNGLNSAYKILFRRDSLIHKVSFIDFSGVVLFYRPVYCLQLVNDYLRETYWSNQNMGTRNDQRTFNLNVAACRLLLGILPGLQYEFVFKV